MAKSKTTAPPAAAPSSGHRVNDKGNAILVCCDCAGETDKGCPPIPGQSDRGFRCPGCQQKIDAAALARSVDTLELSGGG